MLIKRNLLLFFRDKANVFFSLLAVFIIIGLYVLFLGDLMEQSLRNTLGFDSDKIPAVMSGLTLAGMVAVTAVTSCMGAMAISIDDKQKAARDFYTSPVSKSKITVSYILGSSVVGLLMSAFALALCLVYLGFNGGISFTITEISMLLLTTVLSVLCGNAMVYFFASFVKSQNAFSSLSTVVGTLIGFVMGIYIPIGQLPEPVQWIIKCFPMSHAASMYRQIISDGELTALFAGAPSETLAEFRETFGVVFSYGSYTSGFWFSALVLLISSIIFYALSLYRQRVKKTKS